MRDGHGQVAAGDRAQQPYRLAEVAVLEQDVVGGQAGVVEEPDGAVGELLTVVEFGERAG